MMPQPPDDGPPSIVVAEDSAFDRMLLERAFGELDFAVRLTFVGDGEELLDFLRRAAAAAADDHVALPRLVLLDLSMPRMKGLEALVHLRADPRLRMLPVIALTSSNGSGQIAQAYANGVNAFLTKPDQFDDFVDMLRAFGTFWLQTASLPVVWPAT